MSDLIIAGGKTGVNGFGLYPFFIESAIFANYFRICKCIKDKSLLWLVEGERQAQLGR